MEIAKNFFERSAKKVAKELLGKILVLNINGEFFKAKIVETEAYFNESDPASRACQNGDLKKTMMMEAGTVLVYGVHNNWLLNFVTGEKGDTQAVLIRALQPLNFSANCSGPGLLTKAMGINKKFHKSSILNSKVFWIENAPLPTKIASSYRIGIKKDLPEKLRFYIKENKFISRKWTSKN